MSFVLSYKNTCLNKDDLQLLNDGEWLNDKLIGFMFEYFEESLTSDIETSVLYVSPEVTQFIKIVEQSAEVGMFLEPLNAKESDIVIFAVNNHESSDTSGGSHWSLLVFDNKSGYFHHFDSSGKLNEDGAMNLAKKSYPHVNAKSNRPYKFQSHRDCTQQINGYDCGMHVICFTEQLCERLKTYSQNIYDHLAAENIGEKRRYIKQLIKELASKDT